MGQLGGIIGAAIAGVIGAAVWTGIAYATGYEVGFIAWGIGLLVGIGYVAGSRAGGTDAGVFAAAIALLAIIGGKYMTVHLLLNKELNADDIRAEVLEDLQDEEYAISFVADLVVEEYEEAGDEVNWPGGADFGGEVESDYPADIWAEAESRWANLSPQERQDFKVGIADDVIVALDEGMRSGLATIAFLGSFGLLDLIFFALALSTAFKIASSGGEDPHAAVVTADGEMHPDQPEPMTGHQAHPSMPPAQAGLDDEQRPAA